MGKRLEKTMWAVIRIYPRSENVICVSWQRKWAIHAYHDLVDIAWSPELEFYALKKQGRIRVAKVLITEVVK